MVSDMLVWTHSQVHDDALQSIKDKTGASKKTAKYTM
jgi:hypothetical protein